MTNQSIRKKTGLILLGFVLLYWITVPILSFMDIPHKAWIISALVVIGEIIFVIAIALLGKEYWGNIKKQLADFLNQKNNLKIERNKAIFREHYLRPMLGKQIKQGNLFTVTWRVQGAAKNHNVCSKVLLNDKYITELVL